MNIYHIIYLYSLRNSILLTITSFSFRAHTGAEGILAAAHAIYWQHGRRPCSRYVLFIFLFAYIYYIMYACITHSLLYLLHYVCMWRYVLSILFAIFITLCMLVEICIIHSFCYIYYIMKRCITHTKYFICICDVCVKKLFYKIFPQLFTLKLIFFLLTFGAFSIHTQWRVCRSADTRCRSSKALARCLYELHMNIHMRKHTLQTQMLK